MRVARFWLLTQAIMYSTKYDTPVKNCVRHGHSIDDFLADATVQEDWTALKNMVSMATASAASALDIEDEAVMYRRLSPSIGVVLPADSAAALSKLSLASLEEVHEYEKEAAMLAGSIVRLLDSTDTASTLVASLRDSAAIKTPLPEASVRLVVYDVCASSEGARYPKRTSPPVRKEHLLKVMTAFLQSRMSHDEVAALEDGKCPDIAPNDLIFFADSRVENRSPHSPLTAILKGVERKSKWLHVVYNEESLAEKREGSSGASNLRGFMTVNQVEQFQLLYSSLPKYEKRQNKIFTGTTVYDALVGVKCPGLENPKETWRLSWKEKKLMLGASSVTEQVRGQESDGSDARCLDGIEPFNYHQRHNELWLEILFRFNVKAVVDLTASDGVLAQVCCQERVPYVGLCHSSGHASALQSRLNATTFLAMLDPTNERLHKPKLVSLMSPVTGDELVEPKPGRGRLQFVF